MTAALVALGLVAARALGSAVCLHAAPVVELACGSVVGTATGREADGWHGRDAGQRVAEAALSHLGGPYRYGGQDPRTGLDCASFVRLLFRSQGFDLPSTAAGQMRYGKPVAASELAPGDLVFFHDTCKRGISHVGIYFGDGRFIHAAGRKHGVIISTLSRSFFSRHFAGARRLLDQPREVACASEPVNNAVDTAAGR
jgi:cell wall-associated NlpC family hydrolase